MDEEGGKNIGMISCVYFVKRNVAKAVPEKVQLTEEELKGIVEQTAHDMREITEENDSDDDENMETTQEETEPRNPSDEYNFDGYDNEDVDTSRQLGLNSVTTFATDGVINGININTDDPDSDEEDDIIKPNDNLILVGHVQGDASILEVYVHNEDEGSLYVHHDTILPSFPLCIEWLNRDPGDSAPGNLCAIGYMDPIIHIWDLDIINCLEPAFKLGKKANRRKKIKAVGHTDAVVGLAWNQHMDHILASGSVDKTVLLWDIDSGTPHTKLSAFEDNIQSLQWHPLEAQSLLTGCSDKIVRVFDCRTEDAYKSWNCEREIEKVTWDALKPFCFAVGTIDGHLLYYDCRQEDPLWDIEAHEGEISGISLSSKCPGLLVSTSNEGTMKIWDTSKGSPIMIAEKNLAVGATQCLAVCPENPFIFAAGGDFKAKNFGVWDITRLDCVEECFGSRQQVQMSVDI